MQCVPRPASECDLQGRNAPDEAGSVFVRAAEEAWRRVDNLLCLGKNVNGFSSKISCKRKNKTKLLRLLLCIFIILKSSCIAYY